MFCDCFTPEKNNRDFSVLKNNLFDEIIFGTTFCCAQIFPKPINKKQKKYFMLFDFRIDLN